MGLYLNEDGVLTPIAGRGDLTAIRSEMSYLGAKNLLPFNLGHIKKVNGGGTWNGNVYTYRDITYTVNADGTITVDGTASADSIFRVLDTASLAFALNPDKTYYYTGSPATGSSASTYYSYYSELVGSTWTYFMNYGASDTSITPNASATQIVVDIFVKSGKTIDNQVFKPMIRLASDPDNTYVPYAKTNQELTENTSDTGWITVDSANITNMASGTVKYRVKNGYCTISVANVLPTDATAHIDIANIPESKAIVGVSLSHGGNYQTDGWINANTTFRINANSTNTSGRYGSLTYPVD